MLLGAIGLFAFCGAARAQVLDNDGCSNSTLKGDYAFTVSGTRWVKDPNNQNNLIAVQREGMAMTHFKGDETLTQIDFEPAEGGDRAGRGGVDQIGRSAEIDETAADSTVDVKVENRKWQALRGSVQNGAALEPRLR